MISIFNNSTSSAYSALSLPLESSNDSIRNLLKKGLDETLTHQANAYEEMTGCGWYTIENVDASVINKTLNDCECDCED